MTLDLRVLWKDWMVEANKSYKGKYIELVKACRRWHTHCMPIVRSSGFAGSTLCKAFSLLGHTGAHNRTRTCEDGECHWGEGSPGFSPWLVASLTQLKISSRRWWWKASRLLWVLRDGRCFLGTGWELVTPVQVTRERVSKTPYGTTYSLWQHILTLIMFQSALIDVCNNHIVITETVKCLWWKLLDVISQTA